MLSSAVGTRDARTRRTATGSTGGRTRTQHPWPYLLPALAVAAALSVYPLYQLARMAVSDVGPANLIGDWEFIGLGNVADTLRDPDFARAVGATAVFTAVILVADLVIGYLAATAMAHENRLTRLVLPLMVFIWALPPLVSGSVWKFLLAGDGGVNAVLTLVGLPAMDWLSSPRLALWSVSLVAAWASIPFAILIIRGGLLGIPKEVLEAAALDGAGTWQTSIRVIIPLLRPTLLVLVILIVLYSFRSFDFVYVMTSGGPGNATTTLPFLAYETAFKTYSFGAGGAVAMLSMLIVVGLAIPYVIGVRREEGN